MSYRVKTVSELTGIPRNTLVAWERRYKLLDVARTEGGYRLYSDDDVAFLRRLKALVDGGLSISEAIAKAGPQPAAPAAPLEDALWRDLFRHLLEYDRAGAGPTLRRVEQLPFDDMITTVWAPLLREVGRAWEAGEITVAQEHYAAAVVREHLFAMFRSLDGGLGRGPTAVCACLPGEQHDLPLLCLAVRLVLRGWRVTWLGADVPVGDLCSCCAHQKPDLVCLCSVVPGSVDVVTESARQIRACAPRDTIVAVGGPGAQGLTDRSGPKLWFGLTLEEMLVKWEQARKGRAA